MDAIKTSNRRRKRIVQTKTNPHPKSPPARAGRDGGVRGRESKERQ